MGKEEEGEHVEDTSLAWQLVKCRHKGLKPSLTKHVQLAESWGVAVSVWMREKEFRK